MQEQAKEQWQILCEQASTEKNPELLMKLVDEINRLLEQRDGKNCTQDAA